MKKIRKNFKFIIEKTDTGLSAYHEELPIFTTGGSVPELYSNVLEALNLFLEDQSIEATISNVEFEIDLKQFFSYYRILNAKFLAKRIGMNETLLSQYVQGHKKPSKKQTQKILDGIHEIGQELTQITIVSH